MKRFVSCEPLLGPIDFSNCGAWRPGINDLYLGGISWVIAGAETGPGARPAQLDWFRSLRDQCKNAGVPFFLKAVDAHHTRELDGRTWDGMPEMAA